MGRIAYRVARWFWRLLPIASSSRQTILARAIDPWKRIFPSLGWESRDFIPPQPASPDARCLVACTPHTLFLAESIRRELLAVGLQTDLALAIPDEHRYDYVFVIAPQMFARLPRRYIAVQVEQLQDPGWSSDSYLSLLRRADAVIDYSLLNIAALRAAGLSYRRLFYVPNAAIAALDPPDIDDRPIDVLFYGSVFGHRRPTLLRQLGEHLNITVVSDTFGEPMQRLIRSAKVVVNLHHYESARLETLRLVECLSQGTPVVSETTADRSDYPELDGLVSFVDAGDVAGIVAAVTALLASKDRYRERAAAIRAATAGPNRFSSYFRRYLLSDGLTTYDRFAEVAAGYGPAFAEGTPRICLTLPETPERRLNFIDKRTGFTMFDGLRARPPWRGCAMSYKHLFERLRQADVDTAIICEDDVVFRADHQQRLAAIERYLAEHDGEWDVFSGFIAEVGRDTAVSRVDRSGNETFLWLDRAVSMVFNIYSKRAIGALSQWNPETTAVEDTIDRVMERSGLRFVTTTPFLVGPDDGLGSTLWGPGRLGYTGAGERSERALASKQQELTAR